VANPDLALAIFAYNRPQHLARCLASLELNHGLMNLDIHFFIDGPKSDNDKQKLIHVNKIIEAFAERHSNCTVHFAKTNQGLRKSVILGLQSIFSKYSSMIMVEDDLILSSDFLEYMTHLLETFAGDPRIGSISGFRESRFHPCIKKDLLAARRHSCWGWATWRDRWNEISWVEVVDDMQFSRDLQLLGTIGWDLKKIYIEQHKGNISSWAINFDVHAARLGWRSIQPRFTLVENSGLDGSGTHLASGYKRTLPVIPGTRSSNRVNMGYTVSHTFDLWLRVKHSSFSNQLKKVSAYTRLRINRRWMDSPR
jgi:hypothetical protein